MLQEKLDTAKELNVPTEVMFVWAAVESVPVKVTPVIVADEVISPTTSRATVGTALLIPTRSVLTSTNKVSVSTAKSPVSVLVRLPQAFRS
jgi:hypothetical protein